MYPINNVICAFVNDNIVGIIEKALFFNFKFIIVKVIKIKMLKRNIKTEDLLFIDCISAMAGEHGNGDCVFIENPASLEEISMHIGSLLEGIESEKKFLVLDSFSSLLIYNNKNSIEEFAMYLINKLRLNNVNGILVVMEKDIPDGLKKILIAMCDKVIYV